MDADKFTTTSPIEAVIAAAAPLLGMTILWHPDTARIGQQWSGLGSPGRLDLNRFEPMFRSVDSDEMPLGERSISRTPLQLIRDGHDGIEIALPESRMAVQLDGTMLDTTVYLQRTQIDAGVVLTLGGNVLLCLHWISTLPKTSGIHDVIGVGSAATRLRSLISQVARTDLPVLLLGETGTGKEVAAQAIHTAGNRAGKPLVSVNMATLNEGLAAADLFGAARGAYTGAQTAREGLFAEAKDGTLFLDEIGDTPASVQPMLLRVLENGEYRPVGGSTVQRSGARLIAATDRDLGTQAFNQPLLRRLEAFVIRVPPLRERREDIGLLIVHFLREWQYQQHASTMLALPMPLIAQMCCYHWPGNIRQLGHVVRRIAMALQAGEVPSFQTLVGNLETAPARLGGPPVSAPPPRTRKRLDTLSADDVLEAMEQNGWQILAASKALGISRPSLYKLLESHPHIRPAEAIPADELQSALDQHGGDIARCASVLRTPSEALRRRLRNQGLLH
jgi:two-component system nitrogen regulation response regulator GlnG